MRTSQVHVVLRGSNCSCAVIIKSTNMPMPPWCWPKLHGPQLALYPVFMDGGKKAWFQPFAHAQNFPKILGNWIISVFFHVGIMHNCVILVFFRVMGTCSESDDDFASALVLRIIYSTNDTVTGRHGEMTVRWWIVLRLTPRCCAMMY